MRYNVQSLKHAKQILPTFHRSFIILLSFNLTREESNFGSTSADLFVHLSFEWHFVVIYNIQVEEKPKKSRWSMRRLRIDYFTPRTKPTDTIAVM